MISGLDLGQLITLNTNDYSTEMLEVDVKNILIKHEIQIKKFYIDSFIIISVM